MPFSPTKSDVSAPSFTPTKQDVSLPQQEDEAPSILDHARNLIAGTISGVVSPMQATPNMADLAPQGLLQKALPYQQGETRPIDTVDPYGMVGTTQQPISTVAGAEQLAGSLISPIGAFKGSQFLKKLNPTELVKGLQAAHDAKALANSSLYEAVKNEAKARGIDVVPIKSSIIEAVEKHFPSTKRVKDLISEAKTGSYEALHDLQSYMGKQGSKWINNGNKADEAAGEEILEAREAINNAIESHFDSNGHADIGDMLRKGRAGWKNLKETFYEYNPIKNMVHPDLKKVPKNPWSILTEDSVPVNKLMREHPYIAKDVALYLMRKSAMSNPILSKIMNLGAKAVGGAAFGLGAAGTGKKLNDYLSEE